MSSTTNPGHNADPLLTLDDAAEYLGVSRVLVRRLIAEEKIQGTRLGRLIRVRSSHLEAYLNGAAMRQSGGAS